MSTWARYAGGLALVGLIAGGCGGAGGGSVSPGQGTQSTAKAAAIVGAQGAEVYFDGFAAIPTTNPFSTSAAKLPPNLLSKLGNLAVVGFFASVRSSGYTKISGTDLYVEFVLKSVSTGEFLLSTDGSTNNAGNIGISVETGKAGSYPITFGLTVDLILSNETITGKDTLTLYDSSGSDFNLQGTEADSTYDVSIEFNLTYANSLITGSLSATRGSNTVSFTNLSYGSGTYSGTVTAGTVSGTFSVVPGGESEVQTTDSTGTWTLQWDGKDDATLTSPSGVVISESLFSLSP